MARPLEPAERTTRFLNEEETMPKTMTRANARKMSKRNTKSKATHAAKARPRAKKRAPTFGELLIEGMTEAVAHVRGEVTGLRVDRVERPATAREADVSPAPKIKREQILELRQSMQLSQAVFAKALNAKATTVRSWEQGQRVPNGPALRLLEIVSANPQLITDRVRSRK